MPPSAERGPETAAPPALGEIARSDTPANHPPTTRHRRRLLSILLSCSAASLAAEPPADRYIHPIPPPLDHIPAGNYNQSSVRAATDEHPSSPASTAARLGPDRNRNRRRLRSARASGRAQEVGEWGTPGSGRGETTATDIQSQRPADARLPVTSSLSSRPIPLNTTRLDRKRRRKKQKRSNCVRVVSLSEADEWSAQQLVRQPVWQVTLYV